MSSYRNNNNDNSSRYIPRDEDRREDCAPRRDAYYDDWKGLYGKDVARYIYGESNVPITHPSICIPRTFTSIRGKPVKAAVFNTLRELKIGHIERIDVVQKTDSRGERYCTIYAHVQWNVRNELARDTRKKLLDGNDVKIVYDEPWFWKCTASTIEKPENRYSDTQQHRNSSRPRIDLGEGTRAVSRYTQERDEEDGEQHNQGQLCNMDPEEDDE